MAAKVQTCKTQSITVFLYSGPVAWAEPYYLNEQKLPPEHDDGLQVTATVRELSAMWDCFWEGL